MSTSGLASQTRAGAPDQGSAKEALTHFATAFAFLIVGLLALVWNSGRLSQGLFSDGRVLGGLHFITLGWLSLSIFGALRVFTGVALGSQGFGMSLVSWVRRLWTAGAVLFPTGLILNIPALIVGGVACIGTALLLFTIHIVPALFKSKRGGLTRGYLVIALASLWGAWFLGGAAASARAGVPNAPLPQGYLLAHILMAVFGWVGATVVGVGSHLIPMFALSRESTKLPVKAAFPFWAAIPVFAGLGAFFGEPFLRVGFIAAIFGSILWIAQVAIYLRGRLRKERDPGLFIAAGATLFLGAAWAVDLLTNAPIAFVGLIVIGWLTLFTFGIYHRVIPFLVWFARFARNAGRGPVPKVKELIDERLGMTSAVLALAGIVSWAFGLALHYESLTYCGSLFVFCGCAVSIAQARTLFGDSHPKSQVVSEVAHAKGGLSS